jgi:ketosteroid isomerase-like protein
MSRENVAIVRRANNAYNRRDLDDYDELFTADLEWVAALPSEVGGGSFRGREGVERYLQDLASAWEEIRLVGEDFRDLGGRILWLGRIEGRGRGSGVPVDAPLGLIYEFRDDKISRCHAHLDHDKALKAVGLAE